MTDAIDAATKAALKDITGSRFQRGSDEWEAAKNAAYLHAVRHEYSGRTCEQDEHVEGGSDAILASIAERIDVDKPIHAYWGDVIDTLDALVLLAYQRGRADALAGGGLW